MPATYSYKVRVLAAIDAHYNPQHPAAIPLRTIDSKYESDCNANRLFLPSTWRKRVKITLDKLVADGFLAEGNSSYTLTPALRTIIADEKVRLNVGHRNHEWRVFAGVAKKAEPAPAAINGNAAPASSPAGRTRHRTSLNTTEIRNLSAAPPSPSPPPQPTNSDTIRVQAPRKVRYSDPGPLLSRAGPSSVTTVRKPRSVRSSSVFSTPNSRPTPVVSSARRRRSSTTAAKNRRRHTIAIPSARRQPPSPSPEAVSTEIQFFPLKQALSSRTRRALRRNALSEEMNNIDDEKRAGQRKNREELARLRKELADSTERLRELERELAVARYAPSEEPPTPRPQPLPPIDEEQDIEGDFDMGFIPADSPGPGGSFSPMRRSSVTEHQADRMEIDEAPVPNPRDQKIKDLESMIKALRDDIAQRAEEERLRAQEEEVYHDAEEQIMHEENRALVAKLEELQAKKVSFDDQVEQIDDEDDGYMGPLAGDFEDVSDNEDGDATFRSSGVDSGIVTSQITHTTEISAHTERYSELEAQNGQLKGTIETLSEKIREIEDELEANQMSAGEREKAFNKLKKENDKLERLEKELEEKLTELEEMEGERLENIGHMSVQTDEMVDQEKVIMEERMDSLTEQVVELQDMIKAVTAEKREAEARIVVAYSQITALESAAESGETAKVEATSHIRSLTMQIADLQDAVAKENEEFQHRINAANTEIAELQKAAQAGEATKLTAEAEILDVVTQAQELERAVSEERSETNEKIAELEAAVEAGKLSWIEADKRIAALLAQIEEHEALSSEMTRVTQAQLADLRAAVDTAEAAKAEAEAQILALREKVERLEATVTEEKSEAEAIVAVAHTRVAELEAAVEASEAEKVEAQAQIRELESQIEDLQSDITELGDEKAEMQREIDNLVDKVEGLESDIVELREDNQELEREVKDLAEKGEESESYVQELRQDKAGLEKVVKNLEEEAEQLKGAADELSKAKADMETDFNNLSAELSAQQRATELADVAREGFERKVVELQTHIEDFERAADIASGEKAGFEREIAALRTQISSLEDTQALTGQDNQELQKTIDTLNAQIDTFKQSIKDAEKEKGRLVEIITKLNSEVEALKKDGEVAAQQRGELEHTLVNLNSELLKVKGELAAACAENSLFQREIENYRDEIESLGRTIRELEAQVGALQGARTESDKHNAELQQMLTKFADKIKEDEQTFEIAKEQKSIIQQKIRPYIHNEQALDEQGLDMAVDEVLTALVMSKNRADESERIKTELSKRIKSFVQSDDTSDTDSLDPEEVVERLADRFRDVRASVEKLFTEGREIPGAAFEGFDLEDFTWTGSHESSLGVLEALVGSMYEKVTKAHAEAQKLENKWEQEREQCALYGSYLEDIAVVAVNGNEGLPTKDQTLSFVSLRLWQLKRQIERHQEQIAELHDAVGGKDDALANLAQREFELRGQLQHSITSHKQTVEHLNQSRDRITEKEAEIEGKNEKIERLEARIGEQTDKERELRGVIEQRNTAVTELEKTRDVVAAHMEEKLTAMREAKDSVEKLAREAEEKNAQTVKSLEDTLALMQVEVAENNRTLEDMKLVHQEIIESYQGQLAQGKGKLSSLSKDLQESNKEISALKIRLRSSEAEVERQKSALKKATSERDNATKQLDAEILSSHNAMLALEEELQTVRQTTKAQYEHNQQVVASLEDEILVIKNASEAQKEAMQEKIRSQTKSIEELEESIETLQARYDKLEEKLEDTQDSEADMREQLDAAEAQAQFFQEQSEEAEEASHAEKEALRQELEDMIKEKVKLIKELEMATSTLQAEKSALEETVSELNEDNASLEEMLAIEREKGAEAVQSIANDAIKQMARIGDVKNHYIKDSRRREADILNRRKRAREEQGDEEASSSMRMLPTPASSVVASAAGRVRQRDSKRRRYDSGIGVEEDTEEFEGISQVGA